MFWDDFIWLSLCKKCPSTEFFLVRIWTLFTKCIMSFFTFILWYVYICSSGFCWCWDYTLIKNAFYSAFPLHETIFFLSTITRKLLINVCYQCIVVVTAYYFGNIFLYNYNLLSPFNWVAIEFLIEIVSSYIVFVC